MIKKIFLFNNGNAAVFNEKGEQMPRYQKLLSNKNIIWMIGDER